jgi:hypothetical protein
MSEEEKKVPMTKAEIKLTPSHEVYGTRYPVLDYNRSGLHPLLGTLAVDRSIIPQGYQLD